MQRTYELMFIVRPDMAEEDQDKLISNVETQVGTAGGTVKSVERMGKRRLAYTVRKFQDGIYMLMTLEGEGGGMVKEVERRLRVTEPVIKFITVRVDEEQKRLAKIKALRDTKVRGRGTRAAAAAEAAAAAKRRCCCGCCRSSCTGSAGACCAGRAAPAAAGDRSGRRRRVDAGQRLTVLQGRGFSCVAGLPFCYHQAALAAEDPGSALLPSGDQKKDRGSVEPEGESWQTKSKLPEPQPATLPQAVPRAARVKAVSVREVPARVGLVDHVPAAALADVPAAARVKADASFSAARKFASSASKKSTASITRTCACCRGSCRKPARLFPGV